MSIITLRRTRVPLTRPPAFAIKRAEQFTGMDCRAAARLQGVSPHAILSSSMAEHSAVNRRVVGSSPTSGAIKSGPACERSGSLERRLERIAIEFVRGCVTISSHCGLGCANGRSARSTCRQTSGPTCGACTGDPMMLLQDRIDHSPGSFNGILACKERSIAHHGVPQQSLIPRLLSRLVCEQAQLLLNSDNVPASFTQAARAMSGLGEMRKRR